MFTIFGNTLYNSKNRLYVFSNIVITKAAKLIREIREWCSLLSFIPISFMLIIDFV